jgi:hypothetical protein
MNCLESQWLGERLAAIPDAELFPLLNVGSSTLEFRTRTQPYIESNIFEPLRRRSGRVYHLDIKASPGVDIVGNLLDPRFLDEVSRMMVRSIMLSNLLEHVENRQDICDVLMKILPVGGYLFVSGPHDYPYHADPIDTMFRPTVEQVAAHFPGTKVVESAIIDSGNWRHWNVAERGRPLGRALARLMVPFYRPAKWLELARQTPYIFKHIKAFAVVLQKQPEAVSTEGVLPKPDDIARVA